MAPQVKQQRRMLLPHTHIAYAVGYILMYNDTEVTVYAGSSTASTYASEWARDRGGVMREDEIREHVVAHNSLPVPTYTEATGPEFIIG